MLLIKLEIIEAQQGLALAAPIIELAREPCIIEYCTEQLLPNQPEQGDPALKLQPAAKPGCWLADWPPCHSY